jgi:hypothetical protein
MRRRDSGQPGAPATGRQVFSVHVCGRANAPRPTSPLFHRGPQFRADGGLARVHKIFEGKLGEVLGELGNAVWERAG